MKYPKSFKSAFNKTDEKSVFLNFCQISIGIFGNFFPLVKASLKWVTYVSQKFC